ncbi:MAG: transglycosylase domain-containing protein, partial [Pseudomonadota bacterium]|nr:transglycosylase domain-containing protein [Pseudomonadota bacterium]
MFFVIPVLIALGLASVLGVLICDEARTSKLQAEWLSWYGSRISFTMQPGANAKLRTPTTGPYNERLGYSYLPFFLKALQGDDYIVTEQMRSSPTYDYFLDRGLYPIYHPKTVVGLTLFDRRSQPLYSASYPNHVFAKFSDVPPLLVQSLLFIENRELLKDGPITRNPAIEWGRFLHAALVHMLHIFMPEANAGGGSTLATQIEKFRFSPGGQTSGGMDKIRQIASASLRVYLDGPDTRRAREQIALDYLNSTPLGARPGFGEVNSIGDGLWAWFGIDLDAATQALNLPEDDPGSLRAKAHVYRAVLALILAQRRPTFYLVSDRTSLDDLTDAALDRLTEKGVISRDLCNATKDATLHFLPEAPPSAPSAFIEQKAVNALRTHLANMLGLRKLYEVDRLDLSARSTLDEDAEQRAVAFLKKMGDREFLEASGFYGFRLLNPNNDPSKINWSVMLYER